MSRAPWLPVGVLVGLALAAGPVTGSGAPSSTPGNGNPEPADYSWVPIVEPSETTVPDPPGGRWLVDDAGREYTLFRWRRHEGYFARDPGVPNRVRLSHGIDFTLEHEDEQFFYLRWYRTAPLREELAAQAERRRREQDSAIASYRTEIGDVDRLRLEPWDQGLPRAGQWRNRFAIADFNGDGHLDIAHGPARKGAHAAPVIFLSDGAGQWRPWPAASFPAWPYDYGAVAAGDLDGDGNVDLALTAHLRGMVALRGNGRGQFETWGTGLPVRGGEDRRPDSGSLPGSGTGKGAGASTPAFTSRALALADMNGDGRLDILALSEGPDRRRTSDSATLSAGVLDVDGSGAMLFVERSGVWTPHQGSGDMFGDTVLPVDLDGDGRLDFVTDSRVVGSGRLLHYAGAGPGSGWISRALPETRPRLRALAVAVADFDRDGHVDLAVAFQSQDAGRVWHGLDVYLQTPGASAGLKRESIFASPDGWTSGLTALAAGDLDGDGEPDLVALGAAGDVHALLGDGGGGFVRESMPETAPAIEHRFCRGYAVELRDLDRDGRPEIVAAFAGEPGSERSIPGEPAHCRAEGQLRVWKVYDAVTRGGTASSVREEQP